MQIQSILGLLQSFFLPFWTLGPIILQILDLNLTTTFASLLRLETKFKSVIWRHVYLLEIYWIRFPDGYS